MIGYWEVSVVAYYFEKMHDGSQVMPRLNCLRPRRFRMEMGPLPPWTRPHRGDLVQIHEDLNPLRVQEVLIWAPEDPGASIKVVFEDHVACPANVPAEVNFTEEEFKNQLAVAQRAMNDEQRFLEEIGFELVPDPQDMKEK